MKGNFANKLTVNGATFVIIVGIFMLGYSSYQVVNEDEDKVKPNTKIKIIQGAHIPDLLNYVDTDFDNNTILIKNVTQSSSIGMSMQPTLFTGNTVILQNYDHKKDNLKEGWLVRYRVQNKSYSSSIHRIRGVYMDYIITQGDANGTYERINKTDVLGVVIGVLFT